MLSHSHESDEQHVLKAKDVLTLPPCLLGSDVLSEVQNAQHNLEALFKLFRFRLSVSTLAFQLKKQINCWAGGTTTLSASSATSSSAPMRTSFFLLVLFLTNPSNSSKKRLHSCTSCALVSKALAEIQSDSRPRSSVAARSFKTCGNNEISLTTRSISLSTARTAAANENHVIESLKPAFATPRTAATSDVCRAKPSLYQSSDIRKANTKREHLANRPDNASTLKARTLPDLKVGSSC